MAQVNELSLDLSEFCPGAETITSEWFGIIQTGYNHFDGFEQQFESLGGGAVRWPGGTMSETRSDIYSLTNPGIFDARYLYQYKEGRERPGITEMLAFARENGLPFSMVIPTARYASDLEQGTEDVQIFLQRLLSGSFGQLPDHVTLEIGNEYYALDAFSEQPELYGAVSEALVQTILNAIESGNLDAASTNLSIAMQMGHDHADDVVIREQLSDRSLSEIDALVFHSLPISFRNHSRTYSGGEPEDEGETRRERVQDYHSAWEADIRAAGGERAPELFMSAWTVGASAHSPGDLDLDWHDYGLKSAGLMIEMVAAYSSIGVDAAAVWGVDVSNLNTLSQMVDGGMEVSHAGVMFRKLAGRLEGMTLLGEYVHQDRDDPFMTYGFGNGDRVVLYVAASDIPDEGIGLALQLDFGSAFSILKTTSIGTTYEEGFQPTGEASDMLAEKPVVIGADVKERSDGLSLAFSQDYQVVEILIDLERPIQPVEGARTRLADEDNLGTSSSDLLVGSIRSDILIGQSGADVILGDPGEDEPATGLDRIEGGKGDDILMGGPGADTFIFRPDEGSDMIGRFSASDVRQVGDGRYFVDDLSSDFQPGIDRIELRGFLEVGPGSVLNFLQADSGETVFEAEGTRVTLVDVDPGHLAAGDFIFL